MTNRSYILVLLTLLMTVTAGIGSLHADPITMENLPYLCDFEDATENANWVLNPKVDEITTENRWAISEALAYTGKKSMYVSQDNGATNTYAKTNNVMLAYRDITLEAGDYDIAYDWMGMGNTTKGYLKIVYANRPTSGIKCLGNSVEPTWVSQAVQLMGNSTSLYNGDAWRHIQARITIPVAQANKTTTRLFFVWVNTDATVTGDAPTSVAIDNFQLAKASPTDYPSNIHVTTNLGTSVVTWEGSADEYEVLYRKKSDDEFTAVPATGNSVTLQDVDYGAYEFWICSVNGEDKSVYTVFPTVYIYETDCFDALNMYGAEYESGKWSYGRQTGLKKEIQGTERVDYGPSDKRSHHTTHFDLTEFDPRTIYTQNGITYGLKTVPTGAFGSVRLGNWETGSEYDAITFHYTVESNSTAVLLINYAMVLENPNHTAEDQPRFTLDVLDESGNPIDIECASVDFHAPTSAEWNDPEVRELWHSNSWYDGKNNHDINWQDWKTIGISVAAYVGQTLTIILTAYDCDQGGHFGYAYFTLNCVRSDVDGLPWGEGSTTQMFTAPEGFNYAWFNRTDTQFKDTITNTNPAISPYIEENGRYFYVMESDTNTYLCHVTYPTNPECGYWFDASAKPHNPKAELEIQWEPKNCQNGYRWWNRCHVILTNQITGEVEHRYDKQLENSYQLVEGAADQLLDYIDEGTYVPMPAEGGTVRMGVWTGIYVNNKLYADTAWYEVTIPAIGPLETHLYDTICRGEEVIFPADSHIKLTESGMYYDSLSSIVTGCDSTIVMHLHVHEPILTEVYDTICPGARYSFGGKQLTGTGRHTGLFTSMVTGCDSIVTLWLTEAPKPQVQLLETQICANEPLRFETSNSFYVENLHIRIGTVVDSVVPLRVPDAVTTISVSNHEVGTHAAVVSIRMPWCDNVYVDTLTFGVSLSSSLIELHWNDVLSFLSPEYNGGLTFNSYQWYVNGEEIAGATQSYYYHPGMDMDAEYSVHVTMADGSEAWVCPFTPRQAQGMEDISAERRAYKYIKNGIIIIRLGEREYDVLGREITER